jgi:hypothetical protein
MLIVCTTEKCFKTCSYIACKIFTLFSINAEKLKNAAITDLTEGIAAKHRVLAHPVKDPTT